MASWYVGPLVFCLGFVCDAVWCGAGGDERTADIVIVFGDRAMSHHRETGLGAPCTHYLNCTDYYATCSSLSFTCVCPVAYRSNGHFCVYKGESADNIAIYKVTLVVAAVFMVVVFTVFVGCVVKRTCERAREYNERMHELSTDVYTVPAEFEGMEKPPSYTEIVKIDHMIYGVPPPDYDAANTPSGSTTNQAALPPRTQPLATLVRQSVLPSTTPVVFLPLRVSTAAATSLPTQATGEASGTCAV